MKNWDGKSVSFHYLQPPWVAQKMGLISVGHETGNRDISLVCLTRHDMSTINLPFMPRWAASLSEMNPPPNDPIEPNIRGIHDIHTSTWNKQHCVDDHTMNATVMSILFKVHLLTFKCKNGIGPKYLSDLLVSYDSGHSLSPTYQTGYLWGPCIFQGCTYLLGTLSLLRRFENQLLMSLFRPHFMC